MLLFAVCIPFFFADTPKMAYIMVGCHRFFTGGGVEALVPTQILRFFLGRFRAFHNNRFNRQFEEMRVWNVGPANRDTERAAFSFDKHAFLDARATTICGIFAAGFFDCPFFRTPRALRRRPSADCHSQSTPPRSWQVEIRVAQSLSKRPSVSRY